MRVFYTSEARADLSAIRRWIARDNRERAITFVQELVDRTESLADLPNRFPETGATGATGATGIRRLNYRGYRIFYQVESDHVLILHVHHGARADPDLP